ncbi:MAG: cell division FtsA domain-containing protein [Paludibacteraceae bacterium]
MEDIIVAAEIGNSKLAVMAARKETDGQLHVLAVEKESTPHNSVCNGVVCKPTDVVATLNGLLKKMANRLGASVRITKIYVGLNARTLRTTPISVSRLVSAGDTLTDEMLSTLEHEAVSQLPAGKRLQEVSAVTYVSNNNIVAQPQDVVSGHLLATYAVANVDAAVVDKLTQCIAQLPGCSLAEIMLAPKTTAELLTTAADRQGCAVVDFGAGCTSVTVFVNGGLKHFAVIPLGGKHLTADLMTLNDLSVKEAEGLKNFFGMKYAADNTQKERIQIQDAADGTKRMVQVDELKKVFAARLEEILNYVTAQIVLCVPLEKLSAGLILTGGLTAMSHCADIVSDKTGVPARIGSYTHRLTTDSVQAAFDNEYAQLVGVLMNGTEGCVEVMSGKPTKTSKNRFKQIIGKMEGLFNE